MDSELSEQYHTPLAEYKEQEKYLSSVQQQLYKVRYNLLNLTLITLETVVFLLYLELLN